MSGQIYYIAYASAISLAQIANKDLFIEIQRQSATNNQKSGITGFLLFKDGKFFQYFEGEEIVCLQLFEAIKRDLRHRDIKLISEGNITQRLFETWSMNCFDLNQKNTRNDDLNLPEMVENFDVFNWSSENIKLLIARMNDSHLIAITPEQVSYLSALATKFVNQHRTFLIVQTLIGLLLLVSLLLLLRQ